MRRHGPPSALTPRAALAHALAAAMLGLLGGAAAMAQGVCPPPGWAPPAAGVRHLCQVDVRPRLDSGSATYPEILRLAGVAGAAQLRFVVDSSGRVVPGTLRGTSPQRTLFEATALLAAAQWRFSPAIASGRSASVEVVATIEWRPEPRDTVPHVAEVRREFAAEGLGLIVGWRVLPPFAGALAGAAENDIQIAYLHAAIGEIAERDSTALVCVRMLARGGPRDPEPDDLAALARGRMRLFPMRRCPHAYGSMTGAHDSLGRPVAHPPHSDPYRLSVTRIQPWTDSLAALYVTSEIGAGGCREVRRLQKSAGHWIVNGWIRPPACWVS